MIKITKRFHLNELNNILVINTYNTYMLEITKHKITTFMLVAHSGRTILVLIQFCSICHLKIEFSIGLDKLKKCSLVLVAHLEYS